jgi:hypothetical protein
MVSVVILAQKIGQILVLEWNVDTIREIFIKKENNMNREQIKQYITELINEEFRVGGDNSSDLVSALDYIRTAKSHVGRKERVVLSLLQDAEDEILRKI